MANPCPNVGFGLGFLATIGIIYTLTSKYWKINSPTSSQNVFQGIYSYEGLWVRCSSPVEGQFQCDTFDTSFLGLGAQLQGMRAMMCLATIFIGLATCISILTLPCTASLTESKKKSMARVGGCMALVAAEMQAQRAMMCLSTIFAVFGLVAGAVGLNCITIMENSQKIKGYTGRGGGIMMLLAGVLCMATVSWYAAIVVDGYHKAVVTNAAYVYEFGSALYLGWISSGIALIAGILMTCCTCGETDESDVDTYRYNYKPPQAAKSSNRNTEYV